jgi:hypothetical protein
MQQGIRRAIAHIMKRQHLSSRPDILEHAVIANSRVDFAPFCHPAGLRTVVKSLFSPLLSVVLLTEIEAYTYGEYREMSQWADRAGKCGVSAYGVRKRPGRTAGVGGSRAGRLSDNA